MTTILITGANRGIGLEFVRQYAKDGAMIHACTRNPGRATELQELAAQHDGVSVHTLDVTSPDSLAALKAKIGSLPIDILINNAGVMPKPQQLGDMDYEAWAQGFAVNTIAPFRVTETFLPNVEASAGKAIVIITSKMGSNADASMGSYAYRSSKAAANNVAHVLANELRDREIIVVPLHPGWVQTDMGGPHALISVEESVSGLRNVIGGLTMARSGQFLSYDGSEIPW